MIHRLAWRNVWRNKTRSILIIFSVTLGILAGIGVLSIYQGMIRGRVRMVIDSETAHLQLHHPEFKKEYESRYIIPNFDACYKKIQKISGIKFVAPRTVATGMLSTASGTKGVMIYGVDQTLENRVSNLDKKITQGSGLDANKKQGILIGKKLADKLNLRMGKKLVLTFIDSSNNLVASAFRICGIYETGNAPRDEVNVYINIQTMNDLLMIKGSGHEFAVLLQDDDNLDSVEQGLTRAFPFLLVESWKEISPETMLMVKTVDVYSYIIMVIILIAIGFGILNTMLMSVLERTHELGMMMALGISRIRAFGLIFWETVYLTFAGVPFGCFFAYWLTDYFHRNGLNIIGMGKDLMESFGYGTIIYPEFPWNKIVSILLMVILSAMFSSLIPAFKTLRLNPVDALRK